MKNQKAENVVSKPSSFWKNKKKLDQMDTPTRFQAITAYYRWNWNKSIAWNRLTERLGELIGGAIHLVTVSYLVFTYVIKLLAYPFWHFLIQPLYDGLLSDPTTSKAIIRMLED